MLLLLNVKPELYYEKQIGQKFTVRLTRDFHWFNLVNVRCTIADS